MTQRTSSASVAVDCDVLDNDTRGSIGGGCSACGFVRGAAVAFGLMGMAEAIRANRERPIDGLLRMFPPELHAEPVDDDTMRTLVEHFAAEDDDA